MKKLISSILISISLFAFTMGFILMKNSYSVLASVKDTEFFVPASPVEFYELNSPISIDYSSDGYLAISEYKKEEDPLTHEIKKHNRLTLFNPTTSSYTLIAENQNIENITSIVKYGDYVYFLNQSRIYYVPVDDTSATPVSTGVFCSTYFFFMNDTLIANTSNSLSTYELTYDQDDLPVFTEFDNVIEQIETINGFYSTTDEVIYLLEKGGKIKYIDNKNSDISAQLLAEIDKNVISLTDLGNYLYFTSSDGVYSLEKTANATPTKIIEVTPNATALGYLKSPTGITVKDGKLLIADSLLNCIQEFDVEKNEFTKFAITTQSTADYRLTYGASKTCLSEDYLYVLDNASIPEGNETPNKRIIQIDLDLQTNKHKKIDLTNIYSQNPQFKIEMFTASNDRVLIYDGSDLILYKITGENTLTLEEEQRITLSVTAICYLDGMFYYANTIAPELNEYTTKLSAIEIANSENGLLNNAIHNLTPHNEVISGKAVCMTADIFGNVYVVHQKNISGVTSTYLSKIYGGTIVSTTAVDENVLEVQADFVGNVYALTNDSKIYKYSISNGSNFVKSLIEYSPVKQDDVKSISLNYHSEEGYLLGNACVYKTVNNPFEIQSLDKIPANEVNTYNVLEQPKFVSINENAKIFKISFDDLKTDATNKYFDKITPIKNPNVTKAYLVVAELNDYYLVSYSNKFVALVNKTAGAQVISESDYQEYQIEIETAQSVKYITNDVKVFAKPIFDENYCQISLDKGDEVYLVKKIYFNNTVMTLVASEQGGTPIGYVVDSYLGDGESVITPEYQEQSETIGNDGDRVLLISLMILLIAFTVTFTALFIEKKLLFKEE